MAGKPNVPDATVKRAIRLLSTGKATMAEIATLANVARQTVAFWAEREGVDPVKCREQYLKGLWKIKA